MTPMRLTAFGAALTPAALKGTGTAHAAAPAAAPAATASASAAASSAAAAVPAFTARIPHLETAFPAAD
ncbi:MULTISPECIES: hypothetical protein [Streptomyces]|uniref:hypothetical protein n=1 Tax=Streptomyces TaxID=1883 RepID=UPI0013197CCE|nr:MULTISPECIES: hypothetical protein [Streptomyces]QGZ47236.1 hypothetical protein GPZ77_01360 [Streptomyces sp. QHH-9511]